MTADPGHLRGVSPQTGCDMDQRLELDLDLDSDGHGGFRVTVRSAAGEAAGQLRLDPRPVLDRRPQLQATVLASAVTSRAALGEVEEPVRSVGQQLFHALFDDDVYAAYRASLAVAAERGTQLRVVLRTHAPELAALPWEMLFDPDSDAYLCQREPLVRHVSVSSATHALRVSPPLRILGVVSAPRDRARLDVEGEKQRLAAALRPLGSRVELRWVEGGRWVDVQQELVAGSWHVLHFVGHGGFDAVRREGVLALEDDHGGSDLVGADRFGDLLTLQVPPLQLVLLNSCAGGQSAADDLFSSTAATLVRTGVTAVVAMQFAVSDPAAKAFAAGFYQAIAHNHSIAEAVRIGRIGIRGTGEHTLEWITPVLYLRGDDAPLFEVLPGSGAAHIDEGPAPVDAAHEAAVQALYQQAMSRYRAGSHAEALPLFDSVLSLRPDHRDAAERRARSGLEVQVAEALDEGEAAAQHDDWSAAAAHYERVLALDPQRAGVPERLEECRHRQQAADLREELRAHVQAEDWPAAVSVADELERLAPGEGDPDGLATRAREQLRARNESGGGDGDDGDGNGGSSASSRRLLLRVGGALVAVLLLAAGVVWVWRDPPAPFRSAALYELARHHFDPGECHEPQADEFPEAVNKGYAELLVCDGPDKDYYGTLVCHDDEAAFESQLETWLGLAEDVEDVSAPPAGRSEPWPHQMLYRGEVKQLGRVLWYDGESECAALLRAPTRDLEATMAFFSEGNGS